MRRYVTFYNLIFPFWLILYFPPVILLTIIGNYIIDSLVLLGCYKVYGLKDKDINLKLFYKEHIFSVVVYGFLADLIGVALLLLCTWFDVFALSNEIVSAISYNAFSHPVAFIIVLLATLISFVFIFVFNYKKVLKDSILDKVIRFKIAISIAIVTIPWTFFIPMEWFY